MYVFNRKKRIWVELPDDDELVNYNGKLMLPKQAQFNATLHLEGYDRSPVDHRYYYCYFNDMDNTTPTLEEFSEISRLGRYR